jgi:hypothetical protein
MCLYAPNSKVIFTGGWGTGSWNGQWSDWFQFWLKRYFNISATSEVVGSFVGNRVEANDNIDFIYDEALRTSGSGRMWSLKGWSELNAVTERATIASLTGNYLP